MKHGGSERNQEKKKETESERAKQASRGGDDRPAPLRARGEALSSSRVLVTTVLVGSRPEPRGCRSLEVPFPDTGNRSARFQGCSSHARRARVPFGGVVRWRWAGFRKYNGGGCARMSCSAWWCPFSASFFSGATATARGVRIFFVCVFFFPFFFWCCCSLMKACVRAVVEEGGACPVTARRD